MKHLEDVLFDALFDVFERTSRQAFSTGIYPTQCHAMLHCVRPFPVDNDHSHARMRAVVETEHER
jgi:hypothetical protein